MDKGIGIIIYDMEQFKQVENLFSTIGINWGEYVKRDSVLRSVKLALLDTFIILERYDANGNLCWIDPRDDGMSVYDLEERGIQLEGFSIDKELISIEGGHLLYVPRPKNKVLVELGVV